MYLQKGVGNHIRRRLRRVGVNLNDQSVNRSLARMGAATGEVATLDLSSASDTVTIEAVRLLLPDDWFLYLNDIRSQEVLVEGTYVRTEMFSSMGNGFTFELESLLFYALARTTLYFEGISGIVSVYGDDIICPTLGYDSVVWTLRVFGFSTNPDKSFSTGLFRESCGGHYHGQDDVTPFYLRKEATHLTDLIRVANQFRKWVFADPARQYCWPATYTMWRNLADNVPKVLWGGSDYECDTQLVAPVAPISRLSRLTGSKELPDVGLYLHWQNSNWKRVEDPDSPGFLAVNTSAKCRLRPARNGAPYTRDEFYQELFPVPDPG
jgi:hypothetical protein